MSHYIEEIFSLIFKIFFVSFSFQQKSKIGIILEKSYYIFQIFPVSLLNALWTFKVMIEDSQGFPYVFFGMLVTSFMGSLSIAVYGLAGKRKLRQLINQTNQIIEATLAKTAFNFNRYAIIVNAYFAIIVCFLIVLVISESLHPTFDFDLVITLNHRILMVFNLMTNWFNFIFLSTVCLINCCLMAVIANTFAILIKFTYLKNFSAIIGVLYDSAHSLNDIFKLTSLALVGHMAYNITIGIWIYDDSNVLNMDIYSYLLLFSVAVTLCMVETRVYINKNVSMPYFEHFVNRLL